MARKQNDLTVIGISQQFDEKYWDWTDEEKKSLGNLPQMLEVIHARLISGGCEISDMYGITHDKDTHFVLNDVTLEEEPKVKPLHLHGVIRFSKGATLNVLAELIGVQPQYLEKAKKGRFGYDNMLSYLTHIKYIDKHQYEPNEVFTLVGKSYTDIYTERRTDWLKGRAKVKTEKAKADVDYLLEMILTGQIFKDQIFTNDEYYNIYARNASKCDDAFHIYGERRAFNTMQAILNKDIKVSVIYIKGNVESGKSTMAKELCKKLITYSQDLGGNRWRVCPAAASNPLDDFKGEEILFMDDLMGSALSSSDWLKLLDPENAGFMSARYRNKIGGCRCVIITSTRDMVDFFMYCKQVGSSREKTPALDEFLRRIMACVNVYDVDNKRGVFLGLPVKVEPFTEHVNGKTVEHRRNFPAFNRDFDMSIDEAIEVLARMVINNNNLSERTEMTNIDMMLEEHKQKYNDDKKLFEELAELAEMPDTEDKSTTRYNEWNLAKMPVPQDDRETPIPNYFGIHVRKDD